jgi:hypothetical protein
MLTRTSKLVVYGIAIPVLAVAGSLLYLRLSEDRGIPSRMDFDDLEWKVVAASEAPPLESFFRVSSSDPREVDRALAEIATRWHPGSAVMLLEIAANRHDASTANQVFKVFESRTGESSNDFEFWFQWCWKQNFQPHPDYARFKSILYSNFDSRFSEYFRVTENAKIRLDEIRWGRVERDGIPPLKDPKMIEAEQADYLDDTDVVFGVALNDDERCYPQRILAWHEMFKDTIGGIPVCGAY